MIKKVAILTSGGDSPGMNNAIISIVKSAQSNNIEPFLVYEGYKGLYEGNIINATNIKVDKHIAKGGTFIYSSRFPEFKNPKIREVAKQKLEEKGIDALIVIGGDGSYHGAQLLHEIGIKTIALPGTIDNDITSSDFTIGYPTALETIVNSVDKIRDTMTSHNRAAIIEVMGHGCGDLALYGGLATGAELILTNENKKTVDEIAQVFKEQINNKKKRSAIAIVSEFVFPDMKALAKEVEEKSGIITRSISLSHIQRGGIPSAIERVNASLMGMHAIFLLAQDKSGLAIGILNGEVVDTPILGALKIPRAKTKEMVDKINKINQA